MRSIEKKSNTYKLENQLQHLLKLTLHRIDINLILNGISQDLHDNITDVNICELTERSKTDDLSVFSEQFYTQPEASENGKEHEERQKLLARLPEKFEVVGFLNAFKNLLEIDIGCLMSSYIYLKRFLSITNIHLHITTWRPLIFISLIIANKFLYDNYYLIEDFVSFYPFFTIEQVAVMEQKFLEFIDYKVFITEKDYKITIENLCGDSSTRPKESTPKKSMSESKLKGLL